MSALPPEVVEAFTAAAVTVLQELVQVEVFPKIANPEMASGQVVIATIRLVRDSPGSMSLVLLEDTAAKLAARYLPAGTILTPEIIDDVAGEFANVIAGQAKTMLKGTPNHFHLSMPTVVRCDPSSKAVKPNPEMTVCLSTEIGEVVLQAEISSA